MPRFVFKTILVIIVTVFYIFMGHLEDTYYKPYAGKWRLRILDFGTLYITGLMYSMILEG